MRTKHHLTIPTLAAALLLGLTACGSSNNNDPIKSADSNPTHTTKNKHPSSSPSNGSSSTTSSKPTFNFPKDVKVKIEENETGDPTKDKILQDHRYAVLAKDKGLTTGHPGNTFNKYWKKGANIQFRRVFHGYKKDSVTVHGTDRFYNRKVTKHAQDTATVVMCEDQTKFFDKEKKTGKVRYNEANLDSYRKIRSEMLKESSGDWGIVYYHTIAGDKKCQKES